MKKNPSMYILAQKRGELEKLITRLDRGSPRKLVTPYLDLESLFCWSPISPCFSLGPLEVK